MAWADDGRQLVPARRVGPSSEPVVPGGPAPAPVEGGPDLS